MVRSTDFPLPLSLNGSYTCPVCRHGQVAAMPMMETTFSCSFCRHLFTANWEKQWLKMVDSQLPLTWHWNGQNWQGIHHEGIEPIWVYRLAAVALIILPPTLVGLAEYLFPPMPGSPLAWLPTFWTILTFVLHLAFVGWLFVQYYQFPVLMYGRALGQRWLGR